MAEAAVIPETANVSTSLQQPQAKTPPSATLEFRSKSIVGRCLVGASASAAGSVRFDVTIFTELSKTGDPLLRLRSLILPVAAIRWPSAP